MPLDFSDPLSVEYLVQQWFAARASAPRRHSRGKRYFVGHTGMTNSGSSTNQTEPHLAIALYNQAQKGWVPTLPDGRRLALIDYQVPLKARRADVGIGNIDLFGVAGECTSVVIELKLARSKNSPRQTLLQAARYGAMVEANIRAIYQELSARGFRCSSPRPDLILLAPGTYWRSHLKNQAGFLAFQAVADQVGARLGINVLCLVLDYGKLRLGILNTPPALSGSCELHSVKTLFRTG